MKYITVMDKDFKLTLVPERELEMGETLAATPADMPMAIEGHEALLTVKAVKGIAFLNARLPLKL